jgi:hypothetical protein
VRRGLESMHMKGPTIHRPSRADGVRRIEVFRVAEQAEGYSVATTSDMCCVLHGKVLTVLRLPPAAVQAAGGSAGFSSTPEGTGITAYQAVHLPSHSISHFNDSEVTYRDTKCLELSLQIFGGLWSDGDS